MRAYDIGHDYLKDTFSDTHLKLSKVSEISEESVRQVMVKTATQQANDLWIEERCKRTWKNSRHSNNKGTQN